MIARPLAATLLLALAGCGGGTPGNTAQSACEARADADPAYKQDLAIAAGNLNWEFQNEARMQATRKAAVSRCLSGRSGAPRGGVERQQP